MYQQSYSKALFERNMRTTVLQPELAFKVDRKLEAKCFGVVLILVVESAWFDLILYRGGCWYLEEVNYTQEYSATKTR